MKNRSVPPSENNLDIACIKFYPKKRGLHVEIETKQLFMRSYDEEDFEKAVKLYGDEALTRFFDHGRPRSREDTEELMRDKMKYFSKFEPFGLFSIFSKEEAVLVGQVDLLPVGEPGVVEVGCIFDRQYHHRGFAREAIRALIFDYVKALREGGFKCNGSFIYKVIATSHPKNHASKRLIENLGMIFDKSEERFGHPRLWFSLEYKGD